MDIRRVAVYIPYKNTDIVKCVPAYEVPILREVAKRFAKNQEEYKKFGPVDMNRDECGIFQDASAVTELDRLRRTYTQFFGKVYPTDNDFEVAFQKCSKEYGIKTGMDDDAGSLTKRQSLDIEAIDGIGPAFADEVAALLGDGEVETLANAQSYILAGIAGVTNDQIEGFIDQAKVMAGIEDKLTLSDPDTARPAETKKTVKKE